MSCLQKVCPACDRIITDIVDGEQLVLSWPMSQIKQIFAEIKQEDAGTKSSPSSASIVLCCVVQRFVYIYFQSSLSQK
jgi:hypothetical protein